MVTILVALSASLVAQQTGEIVGTVTDKTSAVLPHAKVTMTNTQSKDIRTTTSNAEGFFSFSGVVSGDYSVKVESKGFQAVEDTHVHISPGDRRNLNIMLTVAAENMSITVIADQSTIAVDSGDLSATVDAGDLQKLALTGREATELIKTLPGFNQFTNLGGMQNKANYDSTVTAAWSSPVGNGISGAGNPNRSGGTSLTSDGASIIDPGCNCSATQTINADMVAEIKVTTSAYGADQANGPVVIAAVGKSGTSSYHGEAYFHYRTYQMNSNDFINKEPASLLPRTQDHYYYPGGQISGPIPFTHKKLTAFVGYERYYQQYPDSNSQGRFQANVPTLSERQGLFDPKLTDNAAVCAAMSTSVSGWDSTTKTYHDGHRCQSWKTIATGGTTLDAKTTVSTIANDDISAYIAPGSKGLFALIPKPNRTPTSATDYNYLEPVSDSDNGYMLHARADYAFSDNTKLYVSFNHQYEQATQPDMRWWSTGNMVGSPGCCASTSHSYGLSANLVHVFNASTTNEFLANMGYLYAPDSPENESAIDKEANNYPYNYPNYSPILPSIANSWNSDDGIPFNYDIGRYAYFIKKVQPSISDNFTKVLKTHTVKAGISWDLVSDVESSVGQSNGPNGTLSYGTTGSLPNGAFGNDEVLNFMTDVTNGFSVAPVAVNNDRSPLSMGYYVQDAWKATKRLTFDLGLRLAHDAPYQDGSGKYGGSVWTQALYNADIAKGVTAYPGMRWHGADPAGNGVHTQSSLPLSGRTMNAIFWGPRFGVAYDVYGTGKTVARGGFGVYYFRDGIGAFTGTSMQSGGGSCSLAGTAHFLFQIDATNLQCAYSGGGISSGSAMDPNDHLEPKSLTYNVTISQQVRFKSQFEISYMGSRTTDMTNPLMGAMNSQVAIGTYMKPDPNPKSKYHNQTLALYNSTTGDSNATVSSNTQDYLPYRYYSSTTGLDLITHANGAWSNYNSLQASLFKRQGAFTYNLNYTWSKTMGINAYNNGSAADTINLKNDYGVLNQDRSHVFNATYAYEVGQRFKTNKLVGAVLNGWMLSGLTGLQSGPDFPESSSMNMGFNGTDNLVNNKVTVGTSTVTMTNNTISSTYFRGTPNNILFPKLTCNPGSGLAKNQYINPKCFSVPSLPTIDPATGILTALGGDGQFQMPYFHGPIWYNTDLAVSRTVKIRESQSAQVKMSATNFANHGLTSFDNNNNKNEALNYSSGVLTTSGTGWTYGVPYERFGRRVLELTFKYNF
jgi:hypothetical protein